MISRLGVGLDGLEPSTSSLSGKALIAGATERTLEEELLAEAAAQGRVLQSEDHREAVTAFVERRSPRFTGR